MDRRPAASGQCHQQVSFIRTSLGSFVRVAARSKILELSIFVMTGPTVSRRRYVIGFLVLSLVAIAVLLISRKDSSRMLLFGTSSTQPLDVYIGETRVGRTPMRISARDFRQLVAQQCPGATSLDPDNEVGFLLEHLADGSDRLLFEPWCPGIIFKLGSVQTQVSIVVSAASNSKTTRIRVAPLLSTKSTDRLPNSIR